MYSMDNHPGASVLDLCTVINRRAADQVAQHAQLRARKLAALQELKQAPGFVPSGPRKQGEGVEEDVEQGIVSATQTPSGGAILRVSILAAGFVIGPGGASIRGISEESGAHIQSVTETIVFQRRERRVRKIVIEGRRSCVIEAVAILSAAVDRYKELCEGKFAGKTVDRFQVIRGVEFSYSPPPKSAVPYAAALRPEGMSPPARRSPQISNGSSIGGSSQKENMDESDQTLHSVPQGISSLPGIALDFSNVQVHFPSLSPSNDVVTTAPLRTTMHNNTRLTIAPSMLPATPSIDRVLIETQRLNIMDTNTNSNNNSQSSMLMLMSSPQPAVHHMAAQQGPMTPGSELWPSSAAPSFFVAPPVQDSSAHTQENSSFWSIAPLAEDMEYPFGQRLVNAALGIEEIPVPRTGLDTTPVPILGWQGSPNVTITDTQLANFGIPTYADFASKSPFYHPTTQTFLFDGFYPTPQTQEEHAPYEIPTPPVVKTTTGTLRSAFQEDTSYNYNGVDDMQFS